MSSACACYLPSSPSSPAPSIIAFTFSNSSATAYALLATRSVNRRSSRRTEVLRHQKRARGLAVRLVDLHVKLREDGCHMPRPHPIEVIPIGRKLRQLVGTAGAAPAPAARPAASAAGPATPGVARIRSRLGHGVGCSRHQIPYITEPRLDATRLRGIVLPMKAVPCLSLTLALGISALLASPVRAAERYGLEQRAPLVHS